MMSATIARTITEETIAKFYTAAMEVITTTISEKLNFSIDLHAKQIEYSAFCSFNKNDFAHFVNTEEEKRIFSKCLHNYIKNNGYKNITINITRNSINVEFSW